MTAAHLCEATICLTVAGQEERQHAVTRALREAGIPDFEFFSGMTADSDGVKQALASGAAKRFPPCFRCGLEDCGDPHCNNVLLPVQVAVVLSFRGIFEHCLAREFNTMAICEDDIVFAGYATSVFASADYRKVLEASGLFTEAPTLIRLGNSLRPEGFDDSHYDGEIALRNRVVMSNYLFLCNRAFAAIAHHRLSMVDHTADVLIHRELRKQANCLTLTPQQVCDRSRSLHAVASLIHPKPDYLEHLKRTAGEDSPQFRLEQQRLQRHRKKAHAYRHVFVGLVNCDFSRIIRSCQALGLDIGDGVPARDGFAAWQYTTPTAFEHLADARLNQAFFVHVHARHLVVAEPVSALSDLERRLSDGEPEAELATRLVALEACTPSIDSPASALDRAAALYIAWHRLARQQPLSSILGLEQVDTELEPALAGNRATRPLVATGALEALLSRLAPGLARELLAELAELGFVGACHSRKEDAS